MAKGGGGREERRGRSLGSHTSMEEDKVKAGREIT